MTAPALAARRLVLPAGELAMLCARLGLLLPPRLTAAPVPVRTAGLIVDGEVHPSVAAGLVATCTPQVGVHLESSAHHLAGAFGVRRDLGGSLLRTDGDAVEVSAWPAERLGAELARAVPSMAAGPRPALRLPLEDLPTRAELRDIVVGRLRATVVAPPAVVGTITWLATRAGWLTLQPADVRDGRRWVTVAPVAPADLGAALAPLIGSALA